MKKHCFVFLVIIKVFVNCKGSDIVKLNSDVRRFNGKISFSVKTIIENEERFDKELKLHIDEQDSLFRVKNANDTTWHSYTAPTLRLFLDPREDPSPNNSYYKPLSFNYKYLDTLVEYKYGYGRSRYKIQINTLTQNYTKYNLNNNKIVKVQKHNFYTSVEPFKEVIYKDSLKTIHGFSCFKVMIIEGHLADTVKGMKTYKEMYVTKDINRIYHPVQIRKELLEKYYPLEVKVYSDFLSDKVTHFKVNSIEEFE
jgi:hypothetical protein